LKREVARASIHEKYNNYNKRTILVAYGLLRVEKRVGKQRKNRAEGLRSGRVVKINHFYDKEYSAR
jgi:hypothetical protein